MSTVVVEAISAPQIRSRLFEALDIYVAAMGYPRGTEHHRAPMWAEHILRDGWRAVGAFLTDDPTAPPPSTAPLVGIAYGYRGAAHHWWDQQVRQGLVATGVESAQVETVLGDYFELTELHVHPQAQGRGIGEALLRELLTDRPEQGVLLSTPEVSEEDNRAWHLYRRLGFTDVLRHFVFVGDHRPFAVLGHALPLDGTAPAGHS
ncbi:GNAT family N-acetyltransferase [Rhodococcus sp. D2-41]|uniref:GNAT family N-acetyltransferase n=1 Tax=Speluncibacter jeojiensis TaxID=2710754 RepID=A0A9X4LY81_9ACTN|nr:N-acetyltransferase [Rhodococcus sp. D2-41]MDG3011985.1 GNAT family N-acetyltransferase [Rhodococcus sp. D2-41]MDG3013439.1 GNAT family N-acetyltransferase [Corynebacteriales bacterium D3-21]